MNSAQTNTDRRIQSLQRIQTYVLAGCATRITNLHKCTKINRKTLSIPLTFFSAHSLSLDGILLHFSTCLSPKFLSFFSFEARDLCMHHRFHIQVLLALVSSDSTKFQMPAYCCNFHSGVFDSYGS